MKVLFLSSWFPNRVTPFNGDFVERHALAVSKICTVVAIHVAADNNIKRIFFEIHVIRKLQLLEIIIYFKRKSCFIKPIGTLLNNLFYLTGYLLAYRLAKKKLGKPDIIHANIIYPVGLIVMLWNFFTGIPFVFSEHWTFLLNENISSIPLISSLRRYINKNASALIPVSANLESAMKRHGFKNDFFVIPNVVDTKIFIPNDNEIHFKKIKFLHVSSMKEDQKNIQGIIRTLKKLKDIRNDFVFTFIGAETAAQIELALQSGLNEDFVIFKGEMKHLDVAALMQESHALVLFSRVENLPCVIIEGFACGLPVISSDVGGIGEIVNDSNGILVKSENEDELLKGMIQMLDNYSKYSRTEIRQFAVRNFSSDIIASKLYYIYKKVLSKA